MSDTDAAVAAITAVHADAQRARQRRLVVLAGDRDWACEIWRQWYRDQPARDGVWLGETPPLPMAALAARRATSLLGRDIDCAVIDCWQGLNPDALAQTAGAVVGGGLLVLLAPALSLWRKLPDPDYNALLVHPATVETVAGRFLRHIIKTLETDTEVLLLQQHRAIALPPAQPAPTTPPEPVADPACATADQARAVAAIEHVLSGHRRRPLVLTSDRGRGKSSALGIAAGRILGRGGQQLVITAPSPIAVAPVFQHAARVLGLPAPAAGVKRLEWGGACLRFLPPDALLREAPALDLLLIDEAAAIPAPLLEGLVQRYSRTVFATTVHGYEGTGRGFEIRFRATLNALSNQVRDISLQQPVRWAPNDPVERWLNRALLLDASIAPITDGAAMTPDCALVECLDRDRLLAQPDTLCCLFALLVNAHYQTAPSDLRNLLDGPNIAVWVTHCHGQPVAAALVAGEGGFDAELAAAIWRGERRPRGHLLAQTLAAHGGLREAALLHYWRVVRIAVHPALRGRGFGRQLLLALTAQARQQSIDLVGSSFAATTDVVGFWRSAQFQPVRLGSARDGASGCHSAVVLSALSPAGGALLDVATARFAEQLPRELEHRFRDLDWQLVVHLLQLNTVYTGYQLTDNDWQDVLGFADHARQLFDCRLALWKLVLCALQRSVFAEVLDCEQQQLLVQRVLQYRSRDEVCRALGLSGTKALRQALREAVRPLLARLLDSTRA